VHFETKKREQVDLVCLAAFFEESSMNPEHKQTIPETSSQHLKIITLGQAEVLVDGQTAKWHSESARALFFYLLSHPNGKSREEIIDAIWNAQPSAATNNRLRVTMYRLRNALGWREALVESHSRYQLDQMVLEASDSYEFDLLFAQAEHADSPALRLECFQQALALCAGDYLPLETSTWVLKLRHEHNAACARAQIEVSLLHCNLGLCKASVGVLATALENDPFLGENHHQKLMSCLSVVEGKFASIEHYRRFLAFLNTDIKDTPMPETLHLAARIKNGERICLRAIGQSTLSEPLQNPFIPDFHVQSLPMFEPSLLS
jgi:two-component SAPR family response regulator